MMLRNMTCDCMPCCLCVCPKYSICVKPCHSCMDTCLKAVALAFIFRMIITWHRNIYTCERKRGKYGHGIVYQPDCCFCFRVMQFCSKHCSIIIMLLCCKCKEPSGTYDEVSVQLHGKTWYQYTYGIIHNSIHTYIA